MPTKIDPTLYVRVGTAADLANVSRQWMLQHVQTGKIPGIEIDGQWFALRSAALAFERHPHAGRQQSEETIARREKLARKRSRKKSAE
jgi:hypothetical protein